MRLCVPKTSSPGDFNDQLTDLTGLALATLGIGCLLALVAADDDLLTADQIAAKTSGLARSAVPLGCNHLTVFIDVQQKLLFFVVCAWEDDFAGHVIDYGSYPDQKLPYFTLRDANHWLDGVVGCAVAASIQGCILFGTGEQERGPKQRVRLSSLQRDKR